MGAVHIGICHDNDLMVSQLGDIKIFMDPCTESCDHGFDLRIGIDLIQPCFLHVQDLSSQRKDCLGRPASGSLCRSPCRISLYNIDLTFAGILVYTVRQLAWQGHSIQSRFSPGQLPCLSGRIPGSLRQDRFLHNDLGDCRILFQIDFQLAADNAVNRASCLAVSQFLLGLAFKLRIFDLHTDNSCKSLPDILSGQILLIIL